MPPILDDYVADTFHTAIDINRDIAHWDWWKIPFRLFGFGYRQIPTIFMGNRDFRKWVWNKVKPYVLGWLMKKGIDHAIDDYFDEINESLMERREDWARMQNDQWFNTRSWYNFDCFVYDGEPITRIMREDPNIHIYVLPDTIGLAQSGIGEPPASSAGEVWDTYNTTPIPSAPYVAPNTYKIIYERSDICMGNETSVDKVVEDWHVVNRESGKSNNAPGSGYGASQVQWSRDLYRRTISHEVTRDYYYDTRKVLIMSDSHGNVTRKVLGVKRTHITRGRLIMEDEYKYGKTSFVPVLSYTGPESAWGYQDKAPVQVEETSEALEPTAADAALASDPTAISGEATNIEPTFPPVGSSVSTLELNEDGSFSVSSGRVAGAAASWEIQGALTDIDKRRDDHGQSQITGAEFRAICEKAGDTGTWESLVQNGVSDDTVIILHGY